MIIILEFRSIDIKKFNYCAQIWNVLKILCRRGYFYFSFPYESVSFSALNDQRYLGRYGKYIYPLQFTVSHINLIQRLEFNPRRGEIVKRSRTGTVRRSRREGGGPKEGWRWRYNSNQGLLKKSRDIMSSPGLLNRHTIICVAPIPTAAFN